MRLKYLGFVERFFIWVDIIAGGIQAGGYVQ